MKPKNICSFCLPAVTGVKGGNAPFFLRSVAHKTSACTKLIWACATLLFALCPLAGHAEEADLDAEPPQVRALLDEATTLELSPGNPDKIQRAAMLYCKASKLGSIEAQYRLGMLYFSGRGVQKSLSFASALFSQAAQRGHYQAADMLETVKLRTFKLPPCVA